MNNNLEQENDFLKQCLKIYVEGCEERQQRIDKAIEYIKSNEIDIVMAELLEILEGENDGKIK